MKCVLHIGANKTASTLLQRRLFALHPSIEFLGEGCAGDDDLHVKIRSLIHGDDSFYSEAQTKRLFDSAASRPGKKVFVFSSEDILTARHPSVCAARLKTLMPQAEVVLVMRNQLKVWPSWYINHGAYLKGVPRPYWRRYVTFDDWLEYCFAFPDQSPVEAMNYYRYFQIFERLFGAERIKLLLYEDLRDRPVVFYQQWARILGVEGSDVSAYLQGHTERARLTKRRHSFHRWSSVFPAIKFLDGQWLDKGQAAQIEIPLRWRSRIYEHYAPTNSAIERLTGLSLSSYGYPT